MFLNSTPSLILMVLITSIDYIIFKKLDCTHEGLMNFSVGHMPMLWDIVFHESWAVNTAVCRTAGAQY